MSTSEKLVSPESPTELEWYRTAHISLVKPKLEELISSGKAATYHQAHELIWGRPALSASVGRVALLAKDHVPSDSKEM